MFFASSSSLPVIVSSSPSSTHHNAFLILFTSFHFPSKHFIFFSFPSTISTNLDSLSASLLLLLYLSYHIFHLLFYFSPPCFLSILTLHLFIHFTSESVESAVRVTLEIGLQVCRRRDERLSPPRGSFLFTCAAVSGDSKLFTRQREQLSQEEKGGEGPEGGGAAYLLLDLSD